MRSCAKLSAPAHPRYTRTYSRPPTLRPHNMRVYVRVCLPVCVRVRLNACAYLCANYIYLPARLLCADITRIFSPLPYLPAVVPAIVRPCAQVQTRTHAHISRPSAGSVCVTPKPGRKKSARCGRSLWWVTLSRHHQRLYSADPVSIVF